MFKSFSLLIFKTSWWRLLLGGVVLGAPLLWLALPASIEASRWMGPTTTLQEQFAIQEELLQATWEEDWHFKKGVEIAFNVVALNTASNSGWGISHYKLEQHSWNGPSAHDVGRDARLKAVDSLIEPAKSKLRAAQEARQKIEASRDVALQRLRGSGQDTAATEQSFNKPLQDAQIAEVVAQAGLDSLFKSRELAAATPALSPELTSNIRNAVINRYETKGKATVMLAIYLLLFATLLGAKLSIHHSQRALLALAAVKDKEARAIELRRQMTEARLQTLQAQVEPHYLYNTLANVQALTEVDPPAANKLVGHLIDYLRAALPKMRESTSTVGQELERVRAYLSILKMRMGQRLDFEIQVPDELLPLALPPLMLPTLVENAIKHGLEPKREGGRIEVRVRRELRDGQDHLLLQVADTGAGLSGQEVQAGSGVGLSNLRERLRALYGDNACFTLESNEPSGALATLDMPAQASTEANSGAAVPDDHHMTLAPQVEPNAELGMPSKTRGAWAILGRTYILLLLLMAAGKLFVDWFTKDTVSSKFAIAGVPDAWVAWVVISVLPLVLGLLLLLARRFGMGGLLALVPILVLSLWSPFFAFFVTLLGLIGYWHSRRYIKNSTERTSFEP
jgi:Histidine kinase